MRRLLPLLASILLLALACGGLDDAGEPAVATADPISFGEDDDAVDAYRQSCGAVMTTLDDYMGEEQVPVCEWTAFDQMCEADPSGCWDKEQACKSACPGECAGCEAGCTDTCGTCKDQCGGDDACIVACAEDRARCQEGCVTQRDACFDDRCGAVGGRCWDAFHEKLQQLCPRCDAIRDCHFERALNPSAEGEDCEATYADEDARCFAWCLP